MSPTFPRGIEVLLKKASVDPDFRALLLENSGEAAKAIELELDPMEQALLRTMPPEQLETIIDQIEVPQPERRAFLGTAAAAMIAVLAGSQSALAGGPFPPQKGKTFGGGGGAGNLADMPPGKYGKPMGGGGMGGSGGMRSDMPPGGTFGNRPDEPPRPVRNLRLEVRVLVQKTLGIHLDRVEPSTRIILEGRKLDEFRQAIYDQFDVRMPMKTLKTLRTVKLISDYIVESHEGYEEKIEKPKAPGADTPGS